VIGEDVDCSHMMGISRALLLPFTQAEGFLFTSWRPDTYVSFLDLLAKRR